MIKKIVFRLIGIIILFLFSFLNLYIGYKHSSIIISLTMIVINILVIFVVSKLFLYPDGLRYRYRNYIYLSLVFFLISLMLLYYMGICYNHHSNKVSGTLIIIFLMYVNAFILFIGSKKLHKWVCILLEFLLFLVFCLSFGIYKNIFVTSILLIPFCIVFSAFDELKKK